MVDDIEHYLAKKYYPIIHSPNEKELQDLLLDELEHIFSKNGINMYNYNLPQKSTQYTLDTNNQLI